MSYSTPLPPTVTPGWNDPPMNLGARSNGTGILTQKYRRPVDPSIQISNEQEPGQPKDASALVSSLGRPHSAAAFPTTKSNETFVRTNSAEFHPHQAVYDAFTVPSGLTQSRVLSSQSGISNFTGRTHAAVPLHTKFTSAPDHCSNQASKLPLMNILPPTAAMPIEANPTALIYTPPNTVIEEFQKINPLSHSSNFVPPIKAAGDVSLDARKLVEFLYKAAMRLPPGVTRDGIQLRIGHFDQLAATGTFSDSCIKKLNFIVDALDRENYEEACQFYDQFLVAFPEESRTSWAQGIRLLLQESLHCYPNCSSTFTRY